MSKCKGYIVAEELRGIAKEVTLSCECYMCARCVSCSNNVPVLNYGEGMSNDFVDKVNQFVIDDKERRRG